MVLPKMSEVNKNLRHHGIGSTKAVISRFLFDFALLAKKCSTFLMHYNHVIINYMYLITSTIICIL